MSHWAAQYIGRPWVSGASGPDAFDCWGLVRWIQREHFGREIPPIGVDASDPRAVVQAFVGSPEYEHWLEIPEGDRAAGDICTMTRARYPAHVGLWIEADGGGVLHCAQGAGVIFNRLQSLALAGWGHLRWFRCAR